MNAAIFPSILSADFVNLESDIARIASADGLHCDVMDNHFVPGLAFGPGMVARILQVTQLPVDVHLMLANADRHAPGYAELGAHSVTFHVEATVDVEQTVRAVQAGGAKAAIAIKPGTPIEPYLEMFHLVDMVVIMTVEPGAGGQPFMPGVMPKLEKAAQYIADNNIRALVQVDGGITVDTLPIARAHGANVFVAGSSVYGPGEPADNIAALRAASFSDEDGVR